MLLCEDTVQVYPSELIAKFMLSQKPMPVAATGVYDTSAVSIETKLPPSVIAKIGKLEIPKNKNARRRLAQTISDNVDKINRGTQFKKKGVAIPGSIQRTIGQVGR